MNDAWASVRGGRGITVPQTLPWASASSPHIHPMSLRSGLLASPVFSPIACPEFISFFPPFKDQKGPGKSSTEDFSTLFPKPQHIPAPSPWL